MEYIESRISRLLGEARKLEKNVGYNQINWSNWKSSKNDPEPPQQLLDGDEEYVNPFRYIATSLYMSVVCYLNDKKLNNYLSLFLDIFGKDPNEPIFRDSFEFDHYWSEEPYSVYLSKISQFLSVFEFSESDDERYRRLSGIKYLETILNNTASIISKSNIHADTETKVYKAVKNTLEAIFPSSKTPRSNFIKTAKEYKPDILIPELFTAIEFKHAKDEAKLKTTVEQIAADVKGYTGDKDYKIFYAVFYVVEDFWGRDKFFKVWNEQEFPKNWIPIYVIGK